MGIEQAPKQSFRDELIVENGISGVRGYNRGKFHPITTDMGVEIKGDPSDPTDRPRLQPIIPEGMPGVESKDLPYICTLSQEELTKAWSDFFAMGELVMRAWKEE